ncbi:hypothetical protein KIPB_008172, partial [Kipferlia bialata]
SESSDDDELNAGAFNAIYRLKDNANPEIDSLLADSAVSEASEMYLRYLKVSVLPVLKVRLLELRNRITTEGSVVPTSDSWIRYSVVQLIDNFSRVFAAINLSPDSSRDMRIEAIINGTRTVKPSRCQKVPFTQEQLRKLPRKLQNSVMQQTADRDLSANTHTFMLFIGELAALESGILDRQTRLRLETVAARAAVTTDILSSDSDLILSETEEETEEDASSSEEILSGFEKSRTSMSDELPGVMIRMPCVLQDVFRDLLLNSRKYSDPSTIKGVITNVNMLGGGSELLIIVQDEGIGFADEGELQDAIKVFNKADRPEVKNRRSFGKGFGLTKAYYIVNQCNGTFKVETVKGGRQTGTRMEIRVPLPETVF